MKNLTELKEKMDEFICRVNPFETCELNDSEAQTVLELIKYFENTSGKTIIFP